MTFIRGHQFCFERWERDGNTGWGYQALLPYFTKSESNELGDARYRGANGPLAVSMCTDPHAGHKAFLGAVAQQDNLRVARFKTICFPDGTHPEGAWPSICFSH